MAVSGVHDPEAAPTFNGDCSGPRTSHPPNAGSVPFCNPADKHTNIVENTTSLTDVIN